MGLLIIQILKWILRIILILVLLLLVALMLVLVVPIRYKIEGGFQEKKLSVKGKVTWFFHLIHVKFQYIDDFHIILKVLGISVFDSNKPKKGNGSGEKDTVLENKGSKEADSVDMQETGENVESDYVNVQEDGKNVSSGKAQESTLTSGTQLQTDESIGSSEQTDIQAPVEKNSESRIQESDENNIENILNKIKNLFQKIKDIIQKIKDGKIKAEHYYGLWKREETQVTFRRCKKKLFNMIKAVLPGKWNLNGEVGFADPCTTGQMMAGLGVLYPVLGNRVQIYPDFEKEIMNLEGQVKGHIQIGNLVYQVISLLLNRHCFAFIKLIFNELSNMK